MGIPDERIEMLTQPRMIGLPETFWNMHEKIFLTPNPKDLYGQYQCKFTDRKELAHVISINPFKLG